MKTKATATLVAAALAASFLLPGNADAAIIVNIDQQGSDVVIDYSGSWDTWARSGVGSGFATRVFNRGLFNLRGGEFDSDTSADGGLSLDSGIWTGVLTSADSTTGDIIAWNQSFTYAPLDYTAGDPIAGSMTFNNTDLATMGFTPGDSGTFTGVAGTVNFSVAGAAAVPEPGTWAAAALLAAGATFARWRRRC